MTNNNHNPCQISCATDAELKLMNNKYSYTPYYKQLIKEEINKRAIKAEQAQNYSNKHFLKGMMKI